ncbi:MAG: methylated-DNA--[protein]-cysteine S-methyltransferase [Candidatus Thermoplasmatota archaeon]
MTPTFAQGELARRVHAFVATIPRGRVVTYADVALAVGSPGAGRTVGGILSAMPDGSKLPCHRVVRSDGRVAAGHAGDSLTRGLRRDGVEVTPEGRIVRFNDLRWDGFTAPVGTLK